MIGDIDIDNSDAQIHRLVGYCGNDFSETPLQAELKIRKLTAVLARMCCSSNELNSYAIGEKNERFVKLQIKCNLKRSQIGLTPLFKIVHLSLGLVRIDDQTFQKCVSIWHGEQREKRITHQKKKRKKTKLDHKEKKTSQESQSVVYVKENDDHCLKDSKHASMPDTLPISPKSHKQDEGLSLISKLEEASKTLPGQPLYEKIEMIMAESLVFISDTDEAESDDWNIAGSKKIATKKNSSASNRLSMSPSQRLQSAPRPATINHVKGEGKHQSKHEDSTTPDSLVLKAPISDNSDRVVACDGKLTRNAESTIKRDSENCDTHTGKCCCACRADLIASEVRHKLNITELKTQHENDISELRDMHSQAMQTAHLRLFIATNALDAERQDRAEMIEQAISEYISQKSPSTEI